MRGGRSEGVGGPLYGTPVRSEILVAPDEWSDAVAHTDGPQLVVGGPGAGKSEFLVRRATHLIDVKGIQPEEVLILSFSRRGAADLRTRIAAALDRSGTPLSALTFHSLAMRIIEAHGSAGDWQRAPTLLTGPEQASLVAEVLSAQDPAEWPLPFRDLLGEAAFSDEVADFILRAAERLADGAAIVAQGYQDWRAIPGLLDAYRSTLIERGRIDYGTLQTEAVRLLADPGVQAAISAKTRFVLVDEYQDTTVAQAAIVAGVAGAGNVTVAGDPYQSIYSFRGAELSNVAEFPARFPMPDGSPAQRIVLTTSFRVPAAILDAAVRLTTGAGLPGAAGPMEPAGPGGGVETYSFDQHSNEAEWIASEIQRIHLRDRTPYRRIAVLVRSKRRFLPELSRALDRRGIPHDRPDARLVDHPAVRPLLDLVRAAARPGPDGTAALRRVFLGPPCGLTLSEVRDIERIALSAGTEAALADERVPGAVAALVGDPGWAISAPAADGFWQAWITLDHFADIVTDQSRTDDRAAVASFAQALNRLTERDPSATLADYTRMSEAEDFEATPLLEYRGSADRVTLTTLHQSKGMSFDVVFIADAREGVLPDLRTRDSLLGARRLTPTLGASDTAYATFRLQEERRLAYSAMCRAAVRVVWTCTTTGFDGGEGVPSRFLPLVANSSMEHATRRPRQWSTPTTPLEAEAWLRRRLAEPRLPLVSRLAAAAALAEAAAWRPRHPSMFAGFLERGPDTGLVGSDPVLSASQADSYQRCPRRYAFERRLRVDRGGSSYQELGSVIHAALESAERTAADREDDHATVDDALRALDATFDSAAFGGGAWGEAWRSRAQAIVRRLYELWPGKGPGVGFEEPFETTHAGVRWTGRIDRLERREDGLHVVDYKTGTSVPRVEDAKRSLQLGLYVLAMRATHATPVAGAEFWYPAAGMDRAKSITTRHLDTSLLAEVGELLEATADGIRNERWPTVTGGQCDRCPVRLVCPEWPEGQEAFAR